MIKNGFKAFKCLHCGNIIAMIDASGVPLVCCGENMHELKANTTDGAKEKHVPVVSVSAGKVEVSVGSVEHPMLPEHHIAWVVLETEHGNQIKYLDVTGKPKAEFAVSDGDKPVAVYEYCNLHGLWKAEI